MLARRRLGRLPAPGVPARVGRPALGASARRRRYGALTSRNSLSPCGALIAERNPDLMGSWEGGSNLTLVRPPWRIVEASVPAAEPVAGARLRERRRLALTRLRRPRPRGVRREPAPERRALARQAEREARRAAEIALDWAGGAPLCSAATSTCDRRSTEVFERPVRQRLGCAARPNPDAIDHLLARGLETVGPAHAMAAAAARAGRARGPRAPAPAAVRPRPGRGHFLRAIAFLPSMARTGPSARGGSEPAEPPVRDARPARAEARADSGTGQGGRGARPDRAQRAGAAERRAAHPQAHRGGPRRRGQPRAHDALGRAGDDPEPALAQRPRDRRLPRPTSSACWAAAATRSKRAPVSERRTADRRLRRPVRRAGAGAPRRPHARGAAHAARLRAAPREPQDRARPHRPQAAVAPTLRARGVRRCGKIPAGLARHTSSIITPKSSRSPVTCGEQLVGVQALALAPQRAQQVTGLAATGTTRARSARRSTPRRCVSNAHARR